MWYTYILKCSDDSFYTGHTDDLHERLKRHNAGRGPRWTACRLPIELTYYECHEDETAAIKRERQIKRWSRAKKRALIDIDRNALKKLSRCRNGSV